MVDINERFRFLKKKCKPGHFSVLGKNKRNDIG